MLSRDIEKCFKRAFLHSFVYKKLVFAIPFLFLCGVIVVFCRSLAFTSNNWVLLALIFLPIFFSFLVLYILGIFLIKIYYYEMKNHKISYREVLKNARKNLKESIYIFILPILIFFILWIIFGLFVILKEIPQIGTFLGIILSFIPFLIIFSTILLVVFNLISLFFALPALTLKGKKKLDLVKDVIRNFKKDPFASITFFSVALFLIFLTTLILSISSSLTLKCFSIPLDDVFIGLQWFFIMIPFIILLSPIVIFFFNFSLEFYNLIQAKDK